MALIEAKSVLMFEDSLAVLWGKLVTLIHMPQVIRLYLIQSEEISVISSITYVNILFNALLNNKESYNVPGAADIDFQ